MTAQPCPTIAPEPDWLAGLVHRPVRDLACLLFADPPWSVPDALDPGLLRGEAPRERLRLLDREPQALLAWLAEHPVRRLGRYAELLLAFWLSHSPHSRLVANSLAVRSAGVTLGEFDFLVWLDGEPWHIELACKFYISLSGVIDDCVGVSPGDTLHAKRHNLSRQLALSRRAEALPCLPEGFRDCRVGARVVGGNFGGLETAPGSGTLGGWWRRAGDVLPQLSTSGVFITLPRAAWLSPWRGTELEAEQRWLSGQVLAGAEQATLLAEVVEDARGGWREVARGMVLPTGWQGVSGQHDGCP